MPTIVRENGYEIRIYTLDHPPPHVHVAKAGAVLRIDLATCHVIEIVGTISDREVRRAEVLVTKHVQLLNDEWTKIHGEQRTDPKRS